MLWYSLEAPPLGASNEYPQHMFLNKNIHCMLWYSLEAPPWGASNEYLNIIIFLLRNKKNISSFWTEFIDFTIDY